MVTRKQPRDELLEREDEFAALDAVISDVGAGRGRFAVIEGVAGIGKSSLLAEGRGDGRLVHRRGVTDAPGLYFLGLSWQHTRGSALLGWVGDDAAFIAQQISALGAARGEARAPERVA